MKTPEDLAEEYVNNMDEKVMVKAASTEDLQKWHRIENMRRMDARYRLLAAILNAAETNELCNTTWEDQLLANIRADIRTTVSDWMITLGKDLDEDI